MADAVAGDAAADREGVDTEGGAERAGVAGVEKTGRAEDAEGTPTQDGGKSEVKYAKLVVPMRFIMKGTLKYSPPGCTDAAEGGHSAGPDACIRWLLQDTSHRMGSYVNMRISDF